MEAEPFSACCPSDQSVRSGWIFALRSQGSPYPADGERSGKWLIFASQQAVDELWAKIKRAVEEGELDNLAKVAPACRARKDPRSGEPKQVICVYTHDWADQVEVMRIRLRLRDLGVTWRIGYKADADTAMGRYAQEGHRVCRFWA